MHATCSDSLAPGQTVPILILGGSGFIGTRLTALLTAQRVPVRIGDLRPSEAFPELWAECDVRRQETLGEAASGAGALVNLAAEHRDDVRPLSRYRETNVDGAAQVCLAARNAGIQKIVFTSSVSVYGFHSFPVDESGPFAPCNAYGKTKLEAESVYRAWAGEDPSRTLVIVRPCVVFGEGNRGNVYTLLRQIASGRFLMAGSGKNVKSMAYVGNVAAFLAHTLSLGPGVHVFNYVDRPDMSTGELVEFIQRSLGKPVKTARIPLPVALAAGHLMDVLARLSGRRFPVSAVRVSKFCASTQFVAELAGQSGFSPPYSLREGLARTIQFEFPAQSMQP
jgi:nucleoside-diphosphate-sugar epimerase